MSNEWYTPGKYIQAARLVMGGIDLDPASCEMANQTVQATRYYTEEENGLLQPWYGRVWLNPPYGRLHGKGGNISYQKLFACRLLEKYQAGTIEQAVVLSLGNPSSKWFQPFFDYLICFHLGHIAFLRPDGTYGYFGFPLAFIYLGPHEQRFNDVFSQFGRVVRAIDKPDVEESCGKLNTAVE